MFCVSKVSPIYPNLNINSSIASEIYIKQNKPIKSISTESSKRIRKRIKKKIKQLT